jgi:hypothetical protein
MPAHPAARLSHHCPHNRNRETDRLAAIAEMSEP